MPIDPSMQQFLMRLVILVVTSIPLGLIMIRIAAWLGKQYGLADKPDIRRLNTVPIVRIGGVGIVAGFFITVLLFNGWTWFTVPTWIGLGVILLLALVDDIVDIGAWQLPALLVAIGIAASGVHISFIKDPFTNGYIYFSPLFAGILAFLWIFLLINSVNWLDGMDGLAGGVVLITLSFLALVSFRIGHYQVVEVLVILIGLLSVFLWFNFPPAKIFLGTTGVYFLGYCIAILSIQGGAKIATTFLLLALPILDALSTILRRLLQRKPIYLPDKQHLFHILLAKGFSVRYILFVFYSTTFLLGIVSMIGGTWMKLALLLIVVVGMGGFLLKLSLRSAEFHK